MQHDPVFEATCGAPRWSQACRIFLAAGAASIKPPQCGASLGAMAFDGSSAAFYREQARRIRELADRCVTMDIKEQLEHVAEQYETLARQVESGVLPV
jgi:hypothetical protein